MDKQKDEFLKIETYEEFDRRREEFRGLVIDKDTLEHLGEISPTAYAPEELHVDLFERPAERYIKKEEPAVKSGKWFKMNADEKVWWKDTGDEFWKYIISFDKKNELDLFEDYPHRLTAEEKETFDKEYPDWADFLDPMRNRNSVQQGDKCSNEVSGG